jgi:hypothetical protein
MIGHNTTYDKSLSKAYGQDVHSEIILDASSWWMDDWDNLEDVWFYEDIWEDYCLDEDYDYNYYLDDYYL